jgi:hypothetical protein
MNGTARTQEKNVFFRKKMMFFSEKNVFFSMLFFRKKMFFFGKKCFFSEKNVIGLISVSRNDNTVISVVGLADNPPPEFTEAGH